MDKRIAIERIIVGPLGSNCYLFANRENKKAVLIDVGDEAELIKRKVKGLRLEAIFLTHGHIDHIGAVNFFDVPIFIHQDELEFLNDQEKNMSSFLGSSFSLSKDKDIRTVHDGQIINICDFNLRIIHTPGHTPGSITIQFEDILFTGDALFAGSIGRTDLPYGSTEDLIKAIKNKLLVLPPDTKVYPGHGEQTTIADEKNNNPFLSLQV
ncbi:MAG: MBL fold metallo-hydrolase [Candidatus Omnitrophota bacterium]